MQLLRWSVYALKRLLHTTPVLYAPLYSLVTLNWERVRRFAHGTRFPSYFGGMWTDRSDFRKILAEKVSRGLVDPTDTDLLTQWHERGFVVFNDAIDDETIDRLVLEFDRLPVSRPKDLRVTGGGHLESRPYDPALIKPHDSIRVVDYYFFSEAARSILFHPSITRFLKIVFEAEPLLTQSLSFEHGSEQAIHQDTAFVIMNSPLKFAAAWIALEDIREGSGELIYYPGSHRWSDFLFSGHFKHWDRERDGEAQLQAWHAWIHAEAHRRGVQQRFFRPKKGSLLIWHGGLAHGGARITDPTLTRRSLVGHYCAAGVRPLYHYYKPAQRRIYFDGNRRFTSSHYLPHQFPLGPQVE